MPVSSCSRRKRRSCATPLRSRSARSSSRCSRLTDDACRIGQAARQAGEMRALLAEAARPGAHQPRALGIDLGEQLQAHRHRHLGGGGRRRRAAVAGVVDQRRVGLVPDGGDQRDRRGRGGAHHDLLVEGHQVFETAAAARHDQEIGPRHRAAGRQPVEAFDRGGDLLGRALALDDHRPDAARGAGSDRPGDAGCRGSPRRSAR